MTRSTMPLVEFTVYISNSYRSFFTSSSTGREIGTTYKENLKFNIRQNYYLKNY